MSDYITRRGLEDAIRDVKADMRAMEERWLGWTARVDSHLSDQDTRINWTLGLLASLLIMVIGSLILLVHH